MLQSFFLISAGAVGVLLPLGGVLWLGLWFVEREAPRQRIWRIYFWTLGIAEALLAVPVVGLATSPGRAVEMFLVVQYFAPLVVVFGFTDS